MERKTRRSKETEKIYQKRYAWWIGKGFGESAAKWAASFRLGEPKKKTTEEGEETAISNAILFAQAREAHIRAYLRASPRATREDAIRHFDEQLRLVDKRYKIEQGLLNKETPLTSSKIETNIFREVSP